MKTTENKEITIHIREGILLCVENEIKGAQSQLVSYDKSNKLATDQKTALKLNLECIVEEAIINGGGKNGTVTIRGFREESIARFDGRINNGTPPSEHDLIVDEGIMNNFIAINNHKTMWNSYTINIWVDTLLLFVVTESQWSKVHKELTRYYSPYIKESNISNMLSFLKENVQERRRANIEGALRRLEKESRIETSLEYTKEKFVDFTLLSEREYDIQQKERFVSIDKEEFDIMNRYEREIVASLDVKWDDYSQCKRKSIFSKKALKPIVKQVASTMKEEFSILRYYSKIKVETIDDAPRNNSIRFKEMNDSFVKRFIELTNKRLIDNSDYTSGEGNYGKHFYKTNLYILLNCLGYDYLIKDEYETLLQAIPSEADKVKQVNRVAFELKREQELDGFPF